MRIREFLQRTFRNWPAKILSFAAALLLLVFHDITRLEERFVTVPLELELNNEFVPASAYPQQVRVRLRGESQQVFRVVEEDLRAYIDLRRYTSEGEYRAPVLVAREGTAAETGALEITVEPDSVQVELEEKLLMSLEVEPITSGFPAAGYELVQLVMSPSSVQVEGPRSVVEDLDVVRTEEVDLSTRREDFTERIRLVRPDPLVRFPGGSVVEMRGTIEESVVLETFDSVELVVTGLDSEFRLAESLPGGLIRVQARQIDVESMSPGDMQLSVDASSVDEAGAVRLPVRPIVPSGFVVLRYEPTSVVLQVEEEE
ncbi:MAG: YbbR-like domain-containing protein [Alkalispirochaeta sp.]